ncbi:NACHT domain-containing protein [Streptomyces sp. SP17BM10]|uniref:hypothetical protein n=1 Tax=Streptomyces sp. SP17BM10 TaxID=3002530 RepID=UPI002E75D6C5|nr:hypothetical protein [Streptomyces sp. SP17BM10]MEE1782999.1 NACHT domain-containing protein [Streptomyces sp. SP17BM10]
MTDSVHNSVSGHVTGNVIQTGILNLTPPEPDQPAEDLLAKAVRKQWNDEANARGLTGTVQMPVQWDARELGAASDRSALDDVLASICSLEPIRLIVTGPGGAGKSSLAVLLVRELLERRKPGGPVPVLLSLSSWVPGQNESLDDWVTRRIREDYGELATPAGDSRVQSLVDDEKIIPVLDGLDELMSLSGQEVVLGIDGWRANTEVPLVLLSRPEATEALPSNSELRHIPVIRACPMSPEAGQHYLTGKCSEGQLPQWKEVFEQIAGSPGGPVAAAFSSPLMLWLATKIYASGARDPRELLDSARFPTCADVEGHLLDELLPAVYSRAPAPASKIKPVRRCSVKAARTYHRFLARQLIRRRTQDIAWWQLRGVATLPLAWGGVVLVSVLAFLSLDRLLWPGTTTEAIDLVAELATISTVLGRTTARHLFPGLDGRPRRPATPRIQIITALLAAGLIGAAAVFPGCVPAVVPTVVLPTLSGLVLTRRAEYATATKPRLLLADERRIALIEAAVVAPAIAGLSMAVFSQAHDRPLVPVLSFLAAWSCSAVALVAMSRWGRWSATRIELWLSGRLPWDVMGFLEDAHRLGLLRQVGGVHQYRHAELRWRLAGADADRSATEAWTPRTVLMRSSAHTIRTVWFLALDLAMPVLAYLAVASPLTAHDGPRADWQRSWDLFRRHQPQFVGVTVTLVLMAVALWAVATRLRIDAEAVEINRGRKLRLLWEDVTKVEVHGTDSEVLPTQYHVALKPKEGLIIPKAVTDSQGWARIWDLGPTNTLPLDLEAALVHFAGHRWKGLTTR